MSKKPMYFHELPLFHLCEFFFFEFLVLFSWFSISMFFDKHKEDVFVTFTKPIKQDLALQLVPKQGK